LDFFFSSFFSFFLSFLFLSFFLSFFDTASYILSGSNSVLLNGLSVVIELLRRYAHTTTDDTPTESLPHLLTASLAKLERFDEFLKTPVSANMITTVGELNPLGFYRLKVVDFYLALVRTRYRSVDQQFAKQGTLKLVLDLFFAYRWNNFLHSIVEQLVLTILEGQNDDFKYELLVTAGLLDRIVEANKIQTAEATKPRNARLGYMGFVTNISLAIATVASASSSSPKLEELIENHTEWQNYYNTTLTETRTVMAKPLGGHRPMPLPANAHFLRGETGGSDEEEQPEAGHSIFDQYKLGFTDEFPDDGNDEYGEPFDTSGGGFARDYGHDDKSYELYDEDPGLEEVNSDDSDSEHDENEWTERKIADVGMGNSPSDDNDGFHHSDDNNNNNVVVHDDDDEFHDNDDELHDDNNVHHDENDDVQQQQQQQHQNHVNHVEGGGTQQHFGDEEMKVRGGGGDEFGDFVSSGQES